MVAAKKVSEGIAGKEDVGFQDQVSLREEAEENFL